MNFSNFLFSFLVLCLLVVSSLNAKATPIIVQANENTTVTIFFPSSISKVIAPAPHFSFEHEPLGNMATLRAEKGSPSNLTVITEDGMIFSFALNYSETVQNFTYVISENQAIGRRGGKHTPRSEISQRSAARMDMESDKEDADIAASYSEKDGHESSEAKERETIVEAPARADNFGANDIPSELSEEKFVEKGSFYDMDREGYYQIFCENSYLQRSITKNNMRASSGVDLRLNHLAVDHNEIYFTLQLRNISKSDYHVDGARFYINTPGNEELPMTPVYTYNLEELVKQSDVNKFVYVFKDFQLDPNQRVFVVVEEKGGQRKIILPLDVDDLREGLE